MRVAATQADRDAAMQDGVAVGYTKRTKAKVLRGDAVEKELSTRGWCYAYADPTVFPFDYRWHRCEQERPG